MITEIFGGEGSGARSHDRRGSADRRGSVEYPGEIIRRSRSRDRSENQDSYVHRSMSGPGIIMIIVKVVNIEMIGGEGAEVMRGWGLMEVL